MKHLFFALFLMISASAFAQDSTYNDKISFSISDSTEDGITFRRRATFDKMIYNQQARRITLQYIVSFRGNNAELKSVKPYGREIVINDRNFVVTATGAYVGNKDSMLNLFGIPDTLFPSGWRETVDGRFVLTTPCATWYDYAVRQFDTNNKLQRFIKDVGQAAAIRKELD